MLTKEEALFVAQVAEKYPRGYGDFWGYDLEINRKLDQIYTYLQKPEHG